MILSSLIQARAARKQQVRNLCFELRLNIKKIDGWLNQISQYRNAVNGDCLHLWAGYFDLSMTVSATFHSMLNSGALYNALSHEDIAALQEVYWALSQSGEHYLNKQLNNTRTSFQQLQEQGATQVWMTSLKPESVRIADYWETTLNDHRAKLARIATAIDYNKRSGGEDK